MASCLGFRDLAFRRLEFVELRAWDLRLKFEILRLRS